MHGGLIKLYLLTAFMIEMLHQMIGPIYDFQPLLTRTEVNKELFVVGRYQSRLPLRKKILIA